MSLLVCPACSVWLDTDDDLRHYGLFFGVNTIQRHQSNYQTSIRHDLWLPLRRLCFSHSGVQGLLSGIWFICLSLCRIVVISILLPSGNLIAEPYNIFYKNYNNKAYTYLCLSCMPIFVCVSHIIFNKIPVF